MKRPENRVIDGKSYSFMYMGPKQQIKTMKFIMDTIGSPLGTALGEDGGEGGFLDADAGVVGRFIKEALTSIDDDKVIDQIEILLNHTERKNDKGNLAPVSMEKDFHGELAHLFKVVKAALEVNYGDFLGVSGGFIGKIKSQLAMKNA